MKLDQAIVGAEAAIAEARRREANIAVAVCDTVGRVKAFLKMDGLGDVLSGHEAMRRAVRAAASGAPSEDCGVTVAHYAVEAEGLGGSSRAGGRPCHVGETLLGSIGVAGADDETCIRCAEAGVTAVLKANV